MTTLADLRRESLAEQKADHQDQIPIPDTSNTPSDIATKLTSNVATKQRSNKASNAATKGVKAEEEPAAASGNTAGQQAASLRLTPLEQLNIRIPAGFNEWLSEEAHRRRREGVTKQSLVTDALEAMIRQQLLDEEEANGNT